MIYLDNAGTTKPTQECINDFNYIINEWGNPSSTETDLGNKANDIIENAQEIIKRYLGIIDDGHIYFTSSGSEANTWAIRGILDANPDIRTIITTEIEHASIYNCVNYYKSIGYKVIYVPMNEHGVVDLVVFNDICKKNPDSLVSIMYVNNETGIIQLIHEIAEISHKYGCILHSDCVQAFGHIKIRLDKTFPQPDLISVSGHKIGCFKGIGFLYVGKDIKINPLIFGGKQMNGMRGGTENVPYIYCLGRAINRLDINSVLKNSEQLSYILMEELNKAGINYIINSPSDCWSKNIISITLYDLNDNITASDLLNILANDHDIYISTGSACSSGYRKMSRILKALNISDSDISKTIRVSIGKDTTEKDICAFVAALKKELTMLC